MKELYNKLDSIALKAKNGFITAYEANKAMIDEIEKTDFYIMAGSGTLKEIGSICYHNKYKAYHRMYKLPFEMTKGF